MRRLALIVLTWGALAGAGLGFETPQPGQGFAFPRDDGAHPGFRIEWWYLTGHLFADGRRFGFQSTFFRLAGPPDAPEPNPDFSDREIHLAHMAVTDVATGRFWHEAWLNRAGWDAHAAVGTLDVVNGPWSLRLSTGHPPSLVVHGSVQAEASFDLTWTPDKPLVVFGENGVSRKGADPTAASYYLTYSRLRGGGRLTIGPDTFAVHGEAWMDHEISSSQLSRGQVGWDWTCLQLAGSPWELMVYRMRRADGSADPFSRLQWVDPAGKAVTEPFAWEVLSWWRSPRSGARYPARVRLSTRDPRTQAPVSFVIDPLVADQELTNAVGGGPYWEGACRVSDPAGRPAGSAYLELTGYARALAF